METRLVKGVVNGISLKFKDLKSSGTTDCVFIELQRNDYGLENIQLKSDDIVIDIGANIGMFSIYVKKKFGCKVIAFEPVPLNFKHFKENILLNGLQLSDFQLHNVAITDVENGEIEIGTPEYNTGGSSVFHKCNIISKCKTETLHKYITPNCKYLKVDVEGGEYVIIPNIINELNSFSYLGIEYHKFLANQDPKKLHEQIKNNFNGTIFSENISKY